jgi:hypothetical protein
MTLQTRYIVKHYSTKSLSYGTAFLLIVKALFAATKIYQVSVDAHVSGGPRQALVFSVRNVFVGVDVDVELGQTEVDDVDHLVASQRRSTDLSSMLKNFFSSSMTVGPMFIKR